MFGMSSEEFWEQSPQLYWAYRTFYLKQIELKNEEAKFNCWLQGKLNSIAFGVVLHNSFTKDEDEKINYPDYSELFDKEKIEEEKKMTPTEKKQKLNLKVQEEFNAWARF